MLGNHILLLRRAWAEQQNNFAVPMLLAGFLAILSLLTFWPTYITWILVLSALFCMGWVIWQLWSYVKENPYLEPEQVVPLEDMPGINLADYVQEDIEGERAWAEATGNQQAQGGNLSAPDHDGVRWEQ